MPRFPPDRLRSIAGETSFARGEDYVRRGAVTILSADARGVLARVQGSETYRVRLEGQGRRFTGDCTCPAFDRDGWCKHLVAVALAANAAGDELPDRRAAIRAHLLGLGPEALADMLLDLAWDDPALLRRLDLAARGATATPEEQAALLQERLRDALAEGAEAEYGMPGDWLDEIAAVVAAIPALIARGAGREAKAMLDAVLDDLPEALERLEDGADEGEALLDRAAGLHREACAALRPDPVELAQELFERETEAPYGAFAGAAETYAELLGEAGRAEYRRLAEAALARLPPPARGGHDPRQYDRQVLVRILDAFAEEAGDLEARIALRRAEVRDAQSCLAFARFCLEQGRPGLALPAAEDGAWLYEDDSGGEALALFLAERLDAAGRGADAAAALWKRFERQPSFPLYRALRERSGDAAVDRALGLLRKRRKPPKRSIAWQPVQPVELEIRILADAGRLAEAWALARQHPVPEQMLLDLAEASEAVLPQEAAATYRAAVERRIGLTNRHGYEEACRLLGRLAPLEAPAAHRAFVESLRQRHRAKRSLLPLLDRHLAAV